MSEPKLRIALDIRHPFSYLALGPGLEIAAELGSDADIVPVAAQALREPPPAGASDDRGIRHRRKRAQMIAREIAVYTEAQGLVIRDPYRAGSSSAVILAWLWLRARRPEQLPRFLGEAFRRYWAGALEPDDPADVRRVLRELALPTDECDAWAGGPGPAAAERMAGELRDAGIEQAPAYLVEDQVFFGRQHLPMIRWILAGRSGPKPI